MPVYAVQSEETDITISEDELEEQERAAAILLLEEDEKDLEQKTQEIQKVIDRLDEEIAKMEQRMTPFMVPQLEGEGTKESPYLIDSLETFKHFAECVNAGTTFENLYLKVTEDINLQETINGEVMPWEPIVGFEGNFDGGNYLISGLYIKSATHFQGLFGLTINAEIKNVNLEISHMEVEGDTAGALIGKAENTDISNCVVKGDINISNGMIGGIIGYGQDIKILNSRFEGTIKTSTDSNDTVTSIGGIVGYLLDGHVEGCTTIGSIEGNTDVGGIIGMVKHGKPNSTTLVHYYLQSNLNKADVSGESRVGGIIGSLQNDGDAILRIEVVGNANMGNIKAEHSVGGVVGNAQGNIQIYACYNNGGITIGMSYGSGGGIVGSTNTAGASFSMAWINRCYNAGTVRPHISVTTIRGGGIAGYTGIAIFTSYMIPNGIRDVGSKPSDVTTNIRIISPSRLETLDGNMVNPYTIDENNINDGYPIIASIQYYTGQRPGEDKFWYSSGTSMDYQAKYYYQDDYFIDDARAYNPSLATMSLSLAMSAFASNEAPYEKKSKNVRKLLAETGFTNIKNNDPYEAKPLRDSIGVAIGNKRIREDGEEYTLLAVAVRGQGYETEWAGNLFLGREEEHEGFTIAKEQVLDFLDEYVDEESNDVSDNLKIWIVGFSRSAAVVNLTVGELMRRGKVGNGTEFEQRNVYAYGFETPAGTLLEYAKDGNEQPLATYENIHNIINLNDPVPKVAPYFYDFTRYGIDYEIPTEAKVTGYADMKKTMLKRYAELDSVDKYIVDNFSLKHIGRLPGTGVGVGGVAPMALLDNEDDKRTQNIFLNETINTIAEDIFKNRTTYVAEYQDIIRDILGTLNEQEKSAIDKFKNSFWLKLGAALPLWLVSPVMILAPSDDMMNPPFDDTVTTALSSDIYVHPPDVEKIVRASLSDAGITTVSEEAINNLTEAMTTLLTDFLLENKNATLNLVLNRNSFAEAHYAELCLAWMQAMDINYTEKEELAEFGHSNGSYRKWITNCPVDIEVYDESDSLVASIIDNKPQTIAGSSIISSMNEDGEKLVYLPATTTYTIKMIPTDDGEMNLALNEYSGGKQSHNRIIGYFDLPIEAGGIHTAILPAYSEEDLQSGSVHGSSSNYQVFDDAGNEIKPSISLKGQDAIDAMYRINLYSEDVSKGRVLGQGTRILGSFAQLEAFSQEDYEFDGWYVADTDEKLSDEIEYRFRVEKDMTIIAKFNLAGEAGSVSKDALQEKIKEIEDENLVEADYTEETWTAFSEALQQAQEAVDDVEATQKIVNDILAEYKDL